MGNQYLGRQSVMWVLKRAIICVLTRVLHSFRGRVRSFG